MSADETQLVKIEVNVPESHLRQLQEALRSVDAGHIGAYDSCLCFWQTTGVWRSLPGTNPYIGTIGEVSEEPELKVECTIRREALERTVAAIRAAHPYEEPVIYAIPLLDTGLP